jgi:ribulose-phosphate 3-epimerase
MVDNPVRWIGSCARANADRIIGQVELMEDQKEFCELVKSEDVLCGLALDLPTGIEALDDSILDKLDVIVVMSVNAGFGGQAFDEKAIGKIKELSMIREEKQYHFRICDDGGVTLENENLLQKSGADEISVGRRLFQGNLADNIETWKKTISRYNK